MPSISPTFSPASSIAFFIASTRRSRLDTPGTRPSRLLPMPAMAHTSRSSGDGSIIGNLRNVHALSRPLFDQLTNARNHVGRRRIDVVEQRVDRFAADRIDVGVLLFRVRE